MATDFTGKTALVTGAGRGIGRAVALGLGGAGARVVLLARTTRQLEQTRDLLREQGVPDGRTSVVPADLADEQDRGRAAEGVLAEGRVDILVNNAATVEPLGPTIGIAPADLRLAFEVNVVAPAALTAAVLPGMLEAGWGRVVNVSSGIVSNPAGMVRGNAYAATKAALEAHTVNLAAEMAGTGVTRRIRILGATGHPAQSWVVQQARNLLMDLEDAGMSVKFVLHDRDASFTAAFDAVFQAAGPRVIRSAVQTPRMNSIMERRVGSCRRELLDRTLMWNQRHLMSVLREYEDFYNHHRPHRTLNQAAPLRPLPDGVTDLDHLRVRRRNRVGGVIHGYRVVA